MSVDLAGALRACARGMFAEEAAVELVLGTIWCHRGDFTGAFIRTGTGLSGGVDMAWIDWAEAITSLEAGDLPCSSGEESMLRLAASLGGRIPVDLRDALTGLDAAGLALVGVSVRHAGGRRPDHLT